MYLTALARMWLVDSELQRAITDVVVVESPVPLTNLLVITLGAALLMLVEALLLRPRKKGSKEGKEQ